MKRSTPLKRTGGLRRSGPLKPKSKRQQLRERHYEPVRQEALERDRWQCQRCGTGDLLVVHHKAGRVAGAMFDLGLLVTLCMQCHEWTHRNPAEAYRAGLMIRRNGRSTS